MLFRRRARPGPAARLLEALRPRKGWRRGFAYLGQRMRRLPGTPHSIALGIALGTLVSFSPFYTLHIPITLALAWATGASLAGGFLGTFVGNGLTTPLIAGGAIATGNLLLGRDGVALDFGEIATAFAAALAALWQIAASLFTPAEVEVARLGPFWRDIFLPYLVGGAVTGLAAGALAYAGCRCAVAAYRARRRAGSGGRPSPAAPPGPGGGRSAR